jgi:hypothetical protein
MTILHRTDQRTRRFGAAIAVLGIALASGLGCSDSDDTATSEPTDVSATPDTVVPPDNTDASETTEASDTTVAPETTTETEATEAPETTSSTDVPFTYFADPNPAVGDPVIALCEAYGQLAEPGGTDAVMALMTDDVVVTETVLGEQYQGAVEVAEFVGGLNPTFGIEGSICGDMVQAGNWVAGGFSLLNADGPVSQGIGAMHVTDGKVDQQIIYYTPVAGALEPDVDSGTGVHSAAMSLCAAWADGADPDKILSRMTAEPALYTEQAFIGADAIRALADALPYDVNECGVEIQNGAWEAVANRFTDTAAGVSSEGVNVVLVDPSGLVSTHWVHIETVE